MKNITSCLQCPEIVHSWPKYCKKEKRVIINTAKIPDFCKLEKYKDLDYEKTPK